MALSLAGFQLFTFHALRYKKRPSFISMSQLRFWSPRPFERTLTGVNRMTKMTEMFEMIPKDVKVKVKKFKNIYYVFLELLLQKF